MTKTLFEFYREVDEIVLSDKSLRYGQAMYNHLSKIKPELANKILGTIMDPFYVTDDQKLIKCIEFIEANWNGLENTEGPFNNKSISDPCDDNWLEKTLKSEWKKEAMRVTLGANSVDTKPAPDRSWSKDFGYAEDYEEWKK